MTPAGVDSDGSSHSDSDFSESDKKRKRTGRIPNKTLMKKTLSRNASDKGACPIIESLYSISALVHL
jgi:hypothetical protein